MKPRIGELVKFRDGSTRKVNYDKSIVGKKYGTLLVLDDFMLYKLKNKRDGFNYYTVVKCLCDCGAEKYIFRNNLFNEYPSCGCLSNTSVNLENQRFGMLTVIRQEDSRRGKKSWYCKCDCGGDKICSTKSLRVNNVNSCGCMHYKKRNFHKNWKGTEHISHTFFTAVKKGAKIRNIEFNITIEYVEKLFLEQNMKCALSDIELIFSKVSKNKFGVGNASLDRIDNTIGYVEGNCQWVHKTINIMKNKLPQNEFINFCKLIYLKNEK